MSRLPMGTAVAMEDQRGWECSSLPELAPERRALGKDSKAAAQGRRWHVIRKVPQWWWLLTASPSVSEGTRWGSGH